MVTWLDLAPKYYVGTPPRKNMSTELLATYSGLGTRNGEEYYRGEDCLACVKDLIRSLRGDDPQCTVRRNLGEAKTLQKDLVPLLEQCTDSDGILKGDLIRLMVNLTQPAFLCFNNEYPVLHGKGKKDLESVKNFMETEHHLRGYKEAFTRPSIMNVLGSTLANHCQKEWDDRDDDDTTMIERILLLIRNVLHVVPENEEEKRTSDDVTLHDQVIWNMHMNGLDELLIFLASNEEERHWCMHVLEIVFLMLREQMADVLACCGRVRSHEERKRDDRVLADLLKEEEKKKKLAVKLLGSRHSRFGGTYVASSTLSISDKAQVYHKPLSKIGNFDYDSGKTAKRKPVSRRAVPDQPRKRLSTYSIRMALKEFCVQFLECCYNPIMRVVKDNIQHQRAMENDDTYYLWAVRFFMNFSRHNDFRVEVVGETLTMQTVHYVIQLVGSRYESVIVEKNLTLAKQHSTRLHYAIQAYREILEYIETMSTSEGASLRENAKIMQSNIFYHSEYRELFILLLRSFTPQRSTKDLLRDVVETLHLYLRMLENYLKGRGRMVVQAKRKKQSQMSHKEVDEHERELDGNELSEVWSEVESPLLTTLSDDVDVDLESMDMSTTELNDHNSKKQVVQKIREEIRDRKYRSVVATVRMARTLCPDDIFGTEDMIPGDELEAIKTLFLDQQYGPLCVAAPQSEEQDDVNSEEPVFESYEIDFDMNRFLHKLTATKVIQNLCYLLSFHTTNSDHTNHCLAKIIFRIAFKLKLAPLFYQISVFNTFQEILSSPSSRYKELQKLARHVISGFFHMSESNPMMFVEVLFWRTPADCVDLAEGYGSLQMQRERRKNRNLWTREDEHELTELFEQYKEDEDIVGCIMAALSNPDRSRQGVASHLVKMGLVGDRKELKKKKNTRTRWSPEEDERLRDMYRENELFLQDGGELDIESIAEAFEGKTVDDVKQRLHKLKLIADKKKRKSKKLSDDLDVSASQSELLEFEEVNSTDSPPRVPQKTKKGQKKSGSKAAELIRRANAKKKHTRQAFNSGSIVRLVNEVVKKGMQEAVMWIQEYLLDEAKDREKEGTSTDLCVVPIGEDICTSLRTEAFEDLMSCLGLQPPDDTEMYWRIPEYLSHEKLYEAVSLLAIPENVVAESNQDEILTTDQVEHNTTGTVDRTEVDGTEDRTEVDGTEDMTEVDGTEDMTEVDDTEDMTEVDGTEDITGMDGTEDSTGVDGTRESTGVDGSEIRTGVDGTKDSTAVINGTEDSNMLDGIEENTAVNGTEDSTVVNGIVKSAVVDDTEDSTGVDGTEKSIVVDGVEDSTVVCGMEDDSLSQCTKQDSALHDGDDDHLCEARIQPPTTNNATKKRAIVWSDDDSSSDEGMDTDKHSNEAPKTKKPNLASSDED